VLVAQKPTEGALAHLDRFRAKVHAIQLKEVKGAERHRVVLAAIPEQVEDREAVRIAGDGLAVDNARACRQRGDRGGGQREP